ncbi:tyrosine-type recombinase/integrase [Acinetobacter pittii]|uniref:tyrosine-type recombinase/integrase n=1 Tax=Acinetobacter pittii TaxID=48296 RepID=UPI0024DEE0D9|nr:site-specific integrase [Acinetobacter pittii]
MYRSIYQTKNGKWRVEIGFDKNTRPTKICEIEAAAKRWAKKKERDLILNDATQKAIKNKIVITLREALGRYSEEVSRFKATGKKQIQRIRYYQDNLPNTDWPLSAYKGEFLKQWESAVTQRTIKPLKASTILRDYSTLSAFFNWCRKDKGWIEINPVENIRKPQKPAHRERRTEVEELQAILTALKYKPGTVPVTKMQEVGLIWLIAMATGMRSEEIVNRLPEHVFLSKRYVQLDKTKNGMARKVPLDDFALQLWSLALKLNRKGSPKVFTVSDSSRDALFRKGRKKAGLENADLTFHDSRHEVASLMAKRIKNALALCKVFGWKDPKQALTYYNPTNDEILEELNQTNGLSRLLA